LVDLRDVALRRSHPKIRRLPYVDRNLPRPSTEGIPCLCKAPTLDGIRSHDHVLTPGRYVGAAAVEDDGTPFRVRFAELKAKLEERLAEGVELGALIREKSEGVVVDE
jgi:type I restriction enzyme M protein